MRNKWKCIPLFLLHDWLPLEYVFTYNISYRSSRSQMFFKIAVLNNFANPQENICVGVLIEKRLQHRGFPVNIVTFLRTAFFIEHLWWLLLFFDVVRNRLVFSRFFLFAEISEMWKKNQLEKLVSPMKWSAWLYASTLQNFTRRHFFDDNGVSIEISWDRDIETGENIWKVFKTKTWA